MKDMTKETYTNGLWTVLLLSIDCKFHHNPVLVEEEKMKRKEFKPYDTYILISVKV
jgi:hypothetical protein